MTGAATPSQAGLIDLILVHFGDRTVVDEAVGRVNGAAWASLSVVDNSGNLSGRCHRASVITPPRNLGFGAAVNLAAWQGTAPWIVTLNPDLVIEPEAIEALARCGEENRDLAVIAPRLEHTDGSPQINGGRFSGWAREAARVLALGPPLRRLRGRLRPEARGRPLSPDRPLLRDWVSGAAMCVRRAAFEEVQGFDERFFMYYEDEDLCRRLRGRGWRAAVCPGARALHAVGGSGGSYRSASFARSRRTYHEIHSGPLLRRFVGIARGTAA